MIKNDFNISKSLIRQVQEGSVSFQDLVLYQRKAYKGRVWELRKASTPNLEKLQVLAQGKDLVDLFKKVANHEALPEVFAGLQTNDKFRRFTKSVPGMESVEHREKVSKQIGKIASRIRKPLQIIGEGTRGLKSKQKPWRLLDSDYALEELSQKDSDIPSTTIYRLKELWSKSLLNLSFNEWIQAEKKEWSQTDKAESFLSWLGHKSWNEQEIAAWKDSGTKLTFDEWKVSQYPSDILLPHPLWKLHMMWREDSLGKKSFSKWLFLTTRDLKGDFEELSKESKGVFPAHVVITDAKFKQLAKVWFDAYEKSITTIIPVITFTRHIWEEEGSPLPFEEYILLNRYNFKAPSMGFDEWKQMRQIKLEIVYHIANPGIPFDQWKEQQRLDPLKPVSLVRLDEKMRKSYQVKCNNGLLLRAGQPRQTTFESTMHGGKGWVIFVIGPNDDLYCASHVPNFFHHSSFLGDRAVMAAGEIKTDPTGKITHISSKSGHYQPTDRENKEMLLWFQDRGVDLMGINFTYFTKDGIELPEMSAKEYLDNLP